MTTRSIRIPDELDAALVALAEAEHVSINTEIIRAVEERVRAQAHRARVRSVMAEVMAEDAELLTRLSKT
ncbi:toxin-antitoxin system HicB family antitoxin [Actinomadura atramentaria]|uniref:toxin-antitoxin system HicB family antitoxin n=1 Tax=Actinomadura atramentaria TaxID=1990 RepID=UPI0003695F28|nr:toxin-antitoxin system HicB family antitoxin [Actinomadura atramentaria]